MEWGMNEADYIDFVNKLQAHNSRGRVEDLQLIALKNRYEGLAYSITKLEEVGFKVEQLRQELNEVKLLIEEVEHKLND